MTETNLPSPVPPVTPDTTEFWEATKRGELLLQRCTNCQTVIWYPRMMCPECSGTSLEWFTGSGKGTIYSWTKTYKGQGDYAKAGPYVLAYVQFEEGPKAMTNIIDYTDEDLVIGAPVEIAFTPTEDGTALPRFRPAK